MKYKLPFILSAISLVYASNVKGVDPKRQELYQPSADGRWSCLDGSKIISYSAINDDYCDCPDGSDEPGTSACLNGWFFCENVGHIPAYIKSSAVNDGVCDEACCDGSDENGDLVHCPNRCQQVGEAYRLEQTSLKKSTEAGLQAKRKLIEDATKQITLWQEDKAKLEDELFLKKAHLIRLNREERQHNDEKKKQECASNVNEISALKQGIVVLKKGVDQLKDILSDLKLNHNHNFHDMAVKGAITAYDEFIERYVKIENEINSQLENVQGNTAEPNQVDQNESEDDDTVVVENPELDNVRKMITDAENEIKNLESKLNSVDIDLQGDYGSEKEWLKLKNTCIEKNEGEYTYSLCILGDAHQKSNKDSTRTYLGKFSSFEGKDDKLYTVHSHTHGTRCWNGPERSVKVSFECGSENEILSVTEPEKCEYHFTAKTPAVCQSLADVEHQEVKKHLHEEL